MMALLFGGLVTWRLAHMLSKELGPKAIFAQLRAHAAKKQRQPGGMYDMLSCVGCTSVYTGAVTALWLAGDVFIWIAYTLAFSAIATILEKLYVAIRS
jgi:hypothetical protein